MSVRIHLKASEATGWRFSVWLDAGKNFIGHAMGWLEAQRLVAVYLDDVVRNTVQPMLAEVIAEEDEETPGCPSCTTGYGIELGTLGKRTHYRCRNCGAEFSRVISGTM